MDWNWGQIKILLGILSVLIGGAYAIWVKFIKPLLKFIKEWEALSKTVSEHTDDVIALFERAEYLDRKIDAILYLSDHAMIVCNSDGVCVLANDAACELFGAAENNLKGYGWYNYIHKDDRASAEHIIGQLLKNGGSDVRTSFRVIHGKTEDTVIATYHAIVARDSEGEVLISVGRLNKK